ncbi:hypothetical protein KQI76_10990 [Amphibacillus sp. MSJ-3]|uniref:hypothetical protein n=1 Tax=Amphibacillus sp. MSJ-3 TaxID=2841505 RepID=UPI001C0EF3E4|nr:hypothetical protein [Amphibacillus sp. MSJ-3]MBU5595660.1 hypothetical protein [Amphibacillus sp. MSJ-3]
MKKLIYYLFLTITCFTASLVTISEVSNLSFFDLFSSYEVAASYSSEDYQLKSVHFIYKTDSIATFKINNDEGATGV